MKRSIFIVLCCSAFSSLYALPDLPAKTYSRQDTLVAVQHLFADKRSSGKIYTMVGGCYVLGGLFAPPIWVVGAIPTGFGLIRQTWFRRNREEALLQDYQAGIALPKRIQRRLKVAYF
ncbi:hypothetical protein EXU85_25485 [Spirosoma sp. KCTC 42546]|uniref:hypothetical protein n=1 Tax=Spirosoma sp. KCTC 42546 TaxID=2520506 RepID=UPI00115A4781|nr:hypothetical protein [Spirosoma sp. KCTC 42546]QDK81780.1 hypothetical protein EXU85_25485 [Spirosoma sp. KCTC 42546]